MSSVGRRDWGAVLSFVPCSVCSSLIDFVRLVDGDRRCSSSISSMQHVVPRPSSMTTFRAIGFCGVDDSVDPNFVALVAHTFPLVEFGVLFRPDVEGTPRYASMDWVQRFCALHPPKLAAHLCGSRVNEVLYGDDTFLRQLPPSFQRVQINATAVNGVDTSRLSESAPLLRGLILEFPQLEFILQKNEETQPLWQGLLDLGLPPNVTMLMDESKGTGVLLSQWPNPPEEYDIGYAGGIGPGNIRSVLQNVQTAGNGRAVWIDMESSLRSQKNGKDVFDLDKCYEVIEATCDAGIMTRPSYSPT